MDKKIIKTGSRGPNTPMGPIGKWPKPPKNGGIPELEGIPVCYKPNW